VVKFYHLNLQIIHAKRIQYEIQYNHHFSTAHAFCAAVAVAQPGFGDDVDDVPVDRRLSLLIAAGVGYGIKKVKQARKHQNEKQQF
jgi:hypothetical protein